MRYALPLKHRRREAERMRRLYWSDPDNRLRQINRSRQRQGLPPRQSLDEVAHRGRIA